MTALLTALIALAAVFPTTLAVLGLWVARARLIDGDRVDSVFLPLVFLFVPLIFFVAIFANLGGIALGAVASAVMPGLAKPVSVAAAGALVCVACAWTQRGTHGASEPVVPLSIALFALTDMLILAGGLALLPAH